MDIIWNSLELTRVVFLLGAVLALIYKKKFGVTPGGIIVPGTLAYILSYSFNLFTLTILLGIVYFYIYKFTFGRYAISKKTSTLITITMSVILGLFISFVLQTYHLLPHELFALNVVTPGLIALSIKKYNIKDVLLGTLSVAFLTFLIGCLLASILPLSLLTELTVSLGGYKWLGLGNPYFFLSLSMLVSILIHFRFGIRSGGYLVASYLAAALFSSPIQGALLLIAIVISYNVVKILQKHTLIIGLDRFVFSLFCGYILVTMIDIIASRVEIPGYRTAPLILMIAVAVVTNDLTLHPLKISFKDGVLPSQLAAYAARWSF